jgi:hypothetical protein
MWPCPHGNSSQHYSSRLEARIAHEKLLNMEKEARKLARQEKQQEYYQSQLDKYAHLTLEEAKQQAFLDHNTIAYLYFSDWNHREPFESTAPMIEEYALVEIHTNSEGQKSLNCNPRAWNGGGSNTFKDLLSAREFADRQEQNNPGIVHQVLSHRTQDWPVSKEINPKLHEELEIRSVHPFRTEYKSFEVRVNWDTGEIYHWVSVELLNYGGDNRFKSAQEALTDSFTCVVVQRKKQLWEAVSLIPDSTSSSEITSKVKPLEEVD